MDLASTSAGLYTLSISKIAKLPIRVPSAQEQTEIVRRVDDLLSLADSLERQLDEALARVENLTPSVLAKAFRGELVPQYPNDEPAGKMLERIRKGNGSAAVVAKTSGKSVGGMSAHEHAKGGRRSRASPA